MPTTSERSDTVALPNIPELFEYNPDTVTTFAALHRISAEVLPLALAGLPYGTRQWADDLGLIGGEGDQLHLTEAGQAVAAAAAEREPEPYADVTFEELSAQTRQTIEELRRRSPELALATPHRQPVEQPSQLIARLREAGRELFHGGAEHAGR
jgi:hypothetical protein